MQERNTPPHILESWKQIAAYLECSERTVRRWEACEGLPVHRRRHLKQDSVFAYRHEIEAWRQGQIASPGANPAFDEPSGFPTGTGNSYLVEHDAITRTMHCYVAGARAGDGEAMRDAFHPQATIAGYFQGVEQSGPVGQLFRWVHENGPAPRVEPRLARIEIIESTAVVHLEMHRWSGKLAGTNARVSNVFTLLRGNGEWRITHTLFHWFEQ